MMWMVTAKTGHGADLLQTGSKASTASETVGRQCHEYVQLESTVMDMNLSNLYSKVSEGKVIARSGLRGSQCINARSHIAETLEYEIIGAKTAPEKPSLEVAPTTRTKSSTSNQLEQLQHHSVECSPPPRRTDIGNNNNNTDNF